jgi:methionine-rich copper-binding protein CopC
MPTHFKAICSAPQFSKLNFREIISQNRRFECVTNKAQNFFKTNKCSSSSNWSSTVLKVLLEIKKEEEEANLVVAHFVNF